MAKDTEKLAQEDIEAADTAGKRKHRYKVKPDGTLDTANMTQEDIEALNHSLTSANMTAEDLKPLLAAAWQSLHEAEIQLQETIETARQQLTALESTPEAQELAEIFPDLREYRDLMVNEESGAGVISYIRGILLPILNNFDSFKAYLRRIHYTGTLDEFIINPQDPETGEKLPSLYDTWEAELETETENLPIVKRARLNAADFPVDKINDNVWNLPAADTPGQLTYLLKAEKGHSKKQISLIYSIDFDSIESDLPIVKRLTEWDKRAYIAMGALYNAGNDVMTSTQILRTMGYSGSIAQSYIDKLDKALTKFAARITLDNRQEIAAGYKYPRFVYDGDLLPFERIRAIGENGKVIDSAIHVFREPPLLSFARSRRQITTVKIKMLQGPFSKTEENLAIENYLIERIAHAKSNPQPKNKKILLSTIYEHAGIKTDKQRQRAPEKIKTMLDYYVKDGDITGYEMDKTSITLEV